MGNVTVYLPEDLHEYARNAELGLSALLQEAVRAHRESPLEAIFRQKLEEYRNDPERRAEWERLEPGYPFVPCSICGTGVDEAEGCMATFEPYDAAPVALIAHYPPELRAGNLRYWRDSGFRDVQMTPTNG